MVAPVPRSNVPLSVAPVLPHLGEDSLREETAPGVAERSPARLCGLLHRGAPPDERIDELVASTEREVEPTPLKDVGLVVGKLPMALPEVFDQPRCLCR
mmetsp:Transcript_48686/g.129102  ORF Transcript_48686/g.129102 Transcript_48686/m.129102 type:complete len:99 (+) Transcript_48686:645-941(+)